MRPGDPVSTLEWPNEPYPPREPPVKWNHTPLERGGGFGRFGRFCRTRDSGDWGEEPQD